MAKNIADYLSHKGYNVFFDYSSVKDGKFDFQLLEAIKNCKDFILILTEGSLNDCSKKDDWVSIEIQEAINNKKHILLAQDELKFHAWPANLPDYFDKIKTIDWTSINPKMFKESMSNLCNRLKSKKHPRFIKILKILFVVLLSLISILAIILYTPLSMKSYSSDDLSDIDSIKIPKCFNEDLNSHLDDMETDFITYYFLMGNEDAALSIFVEDLESSYDSIYGEKLAETKLEEFSTNNYIDLLKTSLTNLGAEDISFLLIKEKATKTMYELHYKDKKFYYKRIFIISLEDNSVLHYSINVKREVNFIKRIRYFGAMDRIIKSVVFTDDDDTKDFSY
jgi:hypothetical protein